MDEPVVLVDADGREIGSAPRSRVRGDNLLHAATAVMVRNSAGDVYVQRRSASKDWSPSAHDVGAGGIRTVGETPLACATRELAEELGIEGARLRPLGRSRYEDDETRCVEDLFEVVWDGPVHFADDEVVWGEWMPLERLGELLADPAWPFVPDGRALLEDLARRGVGDYARLLGEVPLAGGNMDPVVRVGETVRRVPGPWTPAVHELLEAIRSSGVNGVPEPRGFDERGREVLEYLPGSVLSASPPEVLWSIEVLEQAGRLLRAVHDGGAGLAASDRVWRSPSHHPIEVVCHNDAAPYNMIIGADRRLGLIDWDTASPGRGSGMSRISPTASCPSPRTPPASTRIAMERVASGFDD